MTPIYVIAGRKARSAVFAPEDPAIHWGVQQLQCISMDARGKPGHDESGLRGHPSPTWGEGKKRVAP
jgi:hypothetical protein